MTGRMGADTVASLPLFAAGSKICKPIAQVFKTKLSPEQLQRLEYFERNANTLDMVFDEAQQAWVVKETIAAELIPIATSTELAPLVPVISQALQEGTSLANAAKVAVADNVIKNTIGLNEKRRELINKQPISSSPLNHEIVDAFKHDFKYHPRIRARAVQDPIAHNFPYSFDDIILQSKAILQKDGSLLYRYEGTLNGKNVFFEIALNPETKTIFHRTFVGKK